MPNKYLIVVDVQKIFTEKNLFDEQKDQTLNNIQRLSNSNVFNRVIVTKCVNEPNSPFMKVLGWAMCTQPFETDLDFMPPSDAIIINRGTYGIKAEELKRMLNAKDDDEFYVIGFDTDACVYAICLNLFDSCMQVRVIEDACYSSDGLASHTLGINLILRNIGAQNTLTIGDII